MDLHDRRVLVTGASRGIGVELARHFAAAGAEVALVARSAERIEKLAADLGGRAYPADLADRTVLADLYTRIELDGPIDVLVNNAGVEHTGPLADTDPDDIDALLDLNLHTPIQLSRLALPGMRRRGTGHIVNMSSIAGSIAAPGLAAYTASKAGLSHFTGCLRAEVKGQGIGTTLVEVGPVATDMLTDGLHGYAPTSRAVARFEKLRLLVNLEPEHVAAATVRAVQRDRRHVRLPSRAAALPMIAELPRRLTELLLTGVDHHTT